MSSYPISKFADNLPATSLIAFAKGAAGFGLGLLLADRLPKEVKQKVAIACITAGTAMVLPFVAGVVSRVSNRPTSSRRMRQSLASIRQDSGLTESEEVI